MSEIKICPNIQAGISIQNPAELKMSVNGERLKDYNLYFNDVYLDLIKKYLTHGRWGVYFKQIDELTPSFVVDIYAETNDDFNLISNIILENKPTEMEFEMMQPYWDYNYYLNAYGK